MTLSSARALLDLDYAELLDAPPPAPNPRWTAAFEALLPPDVLTALPRAPRRWPLTFDTMKFYRVEDFLDYAADVRTVPEAWEVWESRGLLPPKTCAESPTQRAFLSAFGPQEHPATYGEALDFVGDWDKVLRAEALLHEAERRFHALGMPSVPADDARVHWTVPDDPPKPWFPRVAERPWHAVRLAGLAKGRVRSRPEYQRACRTWASIEAESQRWNSRKDYCTTGIGDCRAAVIWAILEVAGADARFVASRFPFFTLPPQLPENPFEPLVSLWTMGIRVIPLKTRAVLVLR